MCHKPVLGVTLPAAQTIICEEKHSIFFSNQRQLFSCVIHMQLWGFRWALAVVSGSACSVKHIWLIIQVWKHWITILSVLWKAWQEDLITAFNLEKRVKELPLSVFPIWENVSLFARVIIISVGHMYHVNTCICICITKYLHSTFSIVQDSSMSVTSMKNHNVFAYKHEYLCPRKEKAIQIVSSSRLPVPGSLCSLLLK